MATIKPLLAKILIQIGADEPKEIGTIEIPIEVSVPTMDPREDRHKREHPSHREPRGSRCRGAAATQLPLRHVTHPC
jgi:hypothetical protein